MTEFLSIRFPRLRRTTDRLCVRPRLRVRIGIHRGDVVEAGRDYLGMTVNKAARVAAAAEPGQIPVSGVTAGLVNKADFEFGASTTVELKGLPGAHVLQPLVWKETSSAAETS